MQKNVTSFHRAMSLGRSQKINNHLLLSAIAAALRKEGDRHCQKHLKMVSQADDLRLSFFWRYTMPGNVFWVLLKGLRKYIEFILSLQWLLLFICVNILFRQKYRITQQQAWVRWVYLLTWVFGTLQMPLPMLHQKKNQLIIITLHKCKNSQN